MPFDEERYKGLGIWVAIWFDRPITEGEPKLFLHMIWSGSESSLCGIRKELFRPAADDERQGFKMCPVCADVYRDSFVDVEEVIEASKSKADPE